MLVVYGSYQFTMLPIDAVPDITDNQVQIITTSPSLSAPDVERLITFPIEQNVSNVPGIAEIRSFSRFGLSLITIVFNDDIDLYWARQQVTERIRQAESQIPSGAGIPELAPVTTGLGEIYQYILRPDVGYENQYGPMELRTIQDWIVRRQLLGVEGVADVSSFGGLLKQYVIEVKPELLRSHNLSLKDVFTALEENNENTGGAYIESSATVTYIRTEGLLRGKDEIGSIPIKTKIQTTAPILIKDIANVVEDHATRFGAITYNTNANNAGAVVMMLKGANSSDVIKAVKVRVAEIQKTLPEGVILEPFLDRSKMVDNAIATVRTNLLEGALIVIFILVLFLGNWRAGLLVASVIPLAMLFAIIMMNMFGVSGNLMSLGALDFGLIVDGAVIIVEAVLHALAQKKFIPKDEKNQLVESSAKHMMNSAVFGQIIILVVYLPIFYLEGIEGKMFRPMAQTIAFALLGAFVLSLTFIPMMSSLVLKSSDHENGFSNRMMQLFMKLHQRILQWILRKKTIVTTLLALSFLLSIWLFTTLGGEFIPELPEGDFAVETRLLTGSNLSTTTEMVTKASGILKAKFPEVEKVVGKIGSGEIPTDPMPMEAADLMIILKPKNEWTSASSWNELSEKMMNELKVLPGVAFSFQFPVAMRFNELMTGAKQDVVCKIFGENLDTLALYAEQLGGVVNSIDGTEGVFVEQVEGLPQLIIRYRRDALSRYNISINDANDIVNTSLAGRLTGFIFEDERRFDIKIRLASESRNHIEDVKNILIPISPDGYIPLEEIADVNLEQSINQIQREDAKRRVIVGFNVADRDVESIVEELQKKVSGNLRFADGYYIKYGGAFENLEAARNRLMIAVPVSLLLILVLLYFAFGSIKQGILIFTTIPMSAIGGILFLWLRQMPFSISAGIGFIALFGVAVLNGIVLLSEFNRIRKAGKVDLYEIVSIGTSNRLRPVLMTAFVASLGFLPMALSHGAGAEVQRPLATVVIGGLLIATFLTLFILPLFYVMFFSQNRKNIFSKKILVSLTIILGTTCLYSQSTISLEAAQDSAMRNGFDNRKNELSLALVELVNSSAAEFNGPMLNIEWGQFNSIYQDNRFGISQDLRSPSVLKYRREVAKNFIQSTKALMNYKSHQIRREVALTYAHALELQEKINWSLKIDTLLQAQSQSTSKLLSSGLSDSITWAIIESKKIELTQQLTNLMFEYQLQLLTLQLIINTKEMYVPIPWDNNALLTAPISTMSNSENPLFMYKKSQNDLAKSNASLDKKLLSPEFNIGYSTTTIKGWGSDNVLYNGSNRFQSIQLSIGIPFLVPKRRAAAKASQLQVRITEVDLQAEEYSLTMEFKAAQLQYESCLRNYRYTKNVSTPLWHTLMHLSEQKLSAGESDVLEYSMLMEKVLALKEQEIKSINDLRNSWIKLKYINTER